MKELKNFKSSNNNKLLLILPIDRIEEIPLNETLYSISEQEIPVDLLILNKGLNNNSLEILNNILKKPTIERKKIKNNSEGSDEIQKLSSENKINFIIESSDSDTFAKIFNESFNYSVKNNYEWFSIIETDDTIPKNWIKYFNLFSNEKQEFDGFLPLTKEIGPLGFAGFMNEACWVEGFSEVAGTFDLNLLLRYNCIIPTGCILKTSSIKNYSEEKDGIFKPMKESMKFNFSYEFFLRMIYNDLKFYTIPRIGYEHKINKPVEKVNLFSSKLPLDLVTKSSEDGGITQTEYKFWMDLAKKEYFFDNDRNKIYQPA